MTDAHCHPWDLLEHNRDAEQERRKTKTAIASSAWNLKEFEYHEGLARKAREDAAPTVFCCFALHPQLSADGDFPFSGSLQLLSSLAEESRLDAVGETGFDLYDARFRAGEKIQDEMFASHLETALRFDLPMVIHVRKAMHKIFPFAKDLKKLPAVVFHSWPGNRGEGEALLKRGINAYFSFGSIVLKNHKEAMTSAAQLSADRILLETDAPYQPLRGKTYSSWIDLSAICSCIADLRKEAGSPCFTSRELEKQTTINFFNVFTRKN